MKDGTIWWVIGLWQVWDDLPDAPVPQDRPPEALIERLAGTFDYWPSEIEAKRAITAAGTKIRHAFENREILGHAILEDAAWKRLLDEGGWLPEGTRRHPPGGRHARLLALAYDLATAGISRDHQIDLWAPAPARNGPRLEDIAANLRSIGDSMGLPPVEFGPEVPFFEGRRPEVGRRRRRSRDRDICNRLHGGGHRGNMTYNVKDHSMTKSDAPSPGQTRTQEEAISYECANEAITHAMAIVSAEIDEVEQQGRENSRRLQLLDGLQTEMARERASLYRLDGEAIRAVRARYGALVRAGREGIRRQAA